MLDGLVLASIFNDPNNKDMRFWDQTRKIFEMGAINRCFVKKEIDRANGLMVEE